MTSSFIGQLIGNRYRLVKHISEGGYGSVYKGEDSQLDDQIVAVKLLRPPSGSDPEDFETLQRRFMDEARVSVLLGEHPHIVKVKSYGVHQNHLPYLVMEFLGVPPATGQGLDLFTRKEGPMDPDRMVRLAKQICSALEYAHQFQVDLGKYSIRGVLHRDIKPSNLFIIQETGQSEYIKVLDFGISKLLGQSDSGLTRSGYFLGTMCYSSPEQMRGKTLDVRSDIYSLGVVLYELLTGFPPLSPENDSLPGWYHVHNFQKPRPFWELPLRFSIPEPLQRVILACLEKNPDNRPSSMQELSELMEAALAGRTARSPTGAHPSGSEFLSFQPQPLTSEVLQQVQEASNAPLTASSSVSLDPFQEAVQLISVGEHKAAIQILNRLIQSEPNEARYYLQRALTHQYLGNFGMAQIDFQGVLRLDPDSAEAQQGLKALADARDKPVSSPAPPNPVAASDLPLSNFTKVVPLQSPGSAGTDQPDVPPQPDSSATEGESSGPWHRIRRWIRWIFANGLGSGLGLAGVLFLLSMEATHQNRSEPISTVFAQLNGVPFPSILTSLMIGCWFGFCLGAAQGIAFWKPLRYRRVWILLTTVGYGLAWALLAQITTQVGVGAIPMISPLSALISTLGVGSLQWLLLRFQLPSSGSWILINGIDTLIVFTLIPLALKQPVLVGLLITLFATRPLAGWMLMGLLKPNRSS